MRDYFEDYTSPVEMITNSIIKSNEEQLDDYLLFSVEREIGFKVDKEELIKALEYDRKQYEKGYNDGLKLAREWIPVESGILPKPWQECLFTVKKSYTNESVPYAVIKKVYTGGNDFIAWIPLIEPYNPEGGQSE